MICKSDHRNGKYCPMCKAVRPLEEFNKCSRNRDGHARLCREHDRERQQVLYNIRNADKPRRKYVRAEDKKPASHARTCAYCGEPFIARSIDKKYCKNACRVAANRTYKPHLISATQVRRLEGLQDKPKSKHVCRFYPPYGVCICGKRQTQITAATATGD